MNWMRFQRQDMARFLTECLDHWQQHGYSPEAMVGMLCQMLQNLQH